MATSEKGEFSSNKEYRLTQTDLELINYVIDSEKHQKALQAGEKENAVVINGEQPLALDINGIVNLINAAVNIVHIVQEVWKHVKGTFQNQAEAINSLIGKRVDENLSLEQLISMRDELTKEMEKAKKKGNEKE